MRFIECSLVCPLALIHYHIKSVSLPGLKTWHYHHSVTYWVEPLGQNSHFPSYRVWSTTTMIAPRLSLVAQLSLMCAVHWIKLYTSCSLTLLKYTHTSNMKISSHDDRFHQWNMWGVQHKRHPAVSFSVQLPLSANSSHCCRMVVLLSDSLWFIDTWIFKNFSGSP